MSKPRQHTTCGGDWDEDRDRSGPILWLIALVVGGLLLVVLVKLAGGV